MPPPLDLVLEAVRSGYLDSFAVARLDGRISLVRREPPPKPHPWLKCFGKKPWGGKS